MSCNTINPEKEGKAVITATSADGGFTASFTLTVTPAKRLADDYSFELGLPEKLEKIGVEAFKEITAASVYIPDTVKMIEARAFADCPYLVYIRIPEGAQIAPDAFTGCEKVVLCGKSGGTAETFAKSNNYRFILCTR